MPSAPYPYIEKLLCNCCDNFALQSAPPRINLPLTVLIRLEAATSRLEDMVPATTDQSAASKGVASLPESGLTAPSVDARGGAASPSQDTLVPLPPSIDDFDALINGDVKTFVNMSEEIGGLVAEQVSRRPPVVRPNRHPECS